MTQAVMKPDQKPDQKLFMPPVRIGAAEIKTGVCLF